MFKGLPRAQITPEEFLIFNFAYLFFRALKQKPEIGDYDWTLLGHSVSGEVTTAFGTELKNQSMPGIFHGGIYRRTRVPFCCFY